MDSRERSGIEFQMRMIGARAYTSHKASAEGLEEEDEDDDKTDDDDVQDVPEVADGTDATGPLYTMTKQGMNKSCGRDVVFMFGAMLQHSINICETGQCLDRKSLIQVVKESGQKHTFRNSQVHPSIVYSALKSVLSTTSSALSPQDCFVQVCGGSLEGVVVVVMLGFGRIIYVGNEKETLWMQMPTEEEEKVNKLDHSSYTSPSIDNPDQGFLAAEVVEMLSPYIHNHVLDMPSVVQVPPPLTSQCLHSRLMGTFRLQIAFSCAPPCLEARRQNLPRKPALGQPAPVEPQPAPVEPQPVGRTRTTPLGQGVQREQSPPPPHYPKGQGADTQR